MKGQTTCRCGCGLDIKNELKVLIADVEKDLRFELVCNSGARCPTYNATIPGSVAGDAHEHCLAVDIAVDPNSSSGRERIGLLIEALIRRGVRRFGDGMAKYGFLHFDRDDSLPTPRWWFYL